MSTAINAYRQILMQPVYETRRRAQAWASWGLAAIVVLAISLCVFFAATTGHWYIVIFGLAGVVFLSVAMGQMIFIPSLMQQNLPSNARLVPHLRRRLMTITAVLWALCSLLFSGLIAIVLGHFGYFLVFAGAGVLYFIAINEMAWLGFLTVVILAVPRITNLPMERIVDAMRSTNELTFTLAGLGVLTVVGMLILQMIFPNGGDRHWARNARVLARTAAFRTGRAAPRKTGANKFSKFGYAIAIRGGTAGRASVGDMLLNALGPGVHWLDSVVITMVLSPMLAMLVWARNSEWLPDPVIGSTALLLLMLPVWTFPNSVDLAISRSVVEQGLLRLAPIAPSASRFNQVFGRALLIRFFGMWLAAAIGMVGINLAFRHGAMIDADVITVSMLFAPFSVVLLRSYAAAPNSQRGKLTIRGETKLVAALMAVLYMVQLYFKFPWTAFCAVVAAGTGYTLRSRWQVMIGQPAAFPAGRIA